VERSGRTSSGLHQDAEGIEGGEEREDEQEEVLAMQ
jgi:hypothetical protein